MSRLSFIFALPLIAAACGGPLEQEQAPEELEAVSSELATAVYVRITGTCFQTYENDQYR